MKADGPSSENQFGLAARLVVIALILIVVYGIYDVTYRYRLPTEGWLIGEGGDSTVIRDLTGLNPSIQPRDEIVSIEDVPIDWRVFESSADLERKWRVGETLRYEIRRDGETQYLPVTLGSLPGGMAFWKDVVGPIGLLGLAASIFQGTLAGFVFLRRPGSPASGAYVLIMWMFLWSDVSELVPFTYAIWMDPVARLLQGGISWVLLGVLFPFSLIWFGMTFPRPKPVYEKRPWLPLAAGGVGLVILVLLPDSELLWFWFLASWFVLIGLLIHSAYTMRDAVSRAQIRWGIGGILIGFGSLAIMLLLNTTQLIPIPMDLFSIVSPFQILIMTGMISIGILRYRLFDIDVIIRRTLQYALLTAILALVYFGGVVVMQEIFGRLTGEQGSPLVTVVSTLGIAALFNPLRTRTQDWIDRRFYRSKYDAEIALADFALVARGEVDIDLLTSSMLSVVQDAIQPESVSIWMKAD